MAAVHLSNVDFSYPLFDLTHRSLKVTLLRQLVGGNVESKGGAVSVQALTDVSIELRDGDRLGLIGHNGSGKSTLLRLIAGLGEPTRGDLVVEGRLIPLIEKGMGINHELTGAANIELPLRLLGASTREIKQAREEIPEWTELGPFMNLPVRTYSEGMKARLSFAICTAIYGDVLVLDEWLGAGDISFLQKAEHRLSSFMNRTKIVVLATHSLSLMRGICNKVAWLDRGSVIMIGDTDMVLAAYENFMSASTPIAAE